MPPGAWRGGRSGNCVWGRSKRNLPTLRAGNQSGPRQNLGESDEGFI